jgi:hypothetical protein
MQNKLLRIIQKAITFLRPSNLRIFFQENKHLVSPVAISLGFIVDNLTLTRIDQTFDNLILVTYLAITTLCILLLHSHSTSLAQKINLKKYSLWIFAIMQFGFGGLFSGFIVFYSRSASLLTGWPFILMLLLFMIGGEVYKQHYSRLSLQISAITISFLAYFIFLVPILFNKLGVGMFLLAGVFGLIMMSLVIGILYRIDKKLIKSQLRMLISIVSGIYLLFNLLYFTNIIPPIPLSLKFANVYQNVSRNADYEYTLTYQATPWYNILRKRSHLVSPDEPKTYVFSAIFAPTNISTTLYHQWHHKTTDGWRRTDRIALPINGGRDDGYRGFTNKTNLAPGKWRVIITTERGQQLGRVHFQVVDPENETKPRIRTETK